MAQPSTPPSKEKKRRKSPGSVGALWRLLFPSHVQDPGGKEICAMALLCLARVWIMNTMSKLVGLLDRNMMTRDQADFWRLWRRSLAMACVASLHRQTYKYFEASLGTIWQHKLTSILHRQYFSATAYYAVAQGAAAAGHPLITDPDERITSDVAQVAQQMSRILCEALYTSTAGAFFAYKLGRLYGIRYALAPYVYIVSCFLIAHHLFPVPWTRLRRNIRRLQSDQAQAHQRVQIHHEAIRAMRGEPYERSELAHRLGALARAMRQFNGATVLSTAADQLLFYWWLRTFVAWFVIGPHILAPRRSRDLSKLGDIAALRGAVGHQFVLFVQSMIAAGMTAKMLRQLQRLGGPAGRVVELMRELKRVRKEREEKDVAGVVEGDCIAFEGVTVRTPTGVLLVKDLTFKLEKGKALLLTGHNGAGKSSIFRVLGGLWKASGKIMKPQSAASGLHQDVFYIPQKPYNVLGTLKDQLSYPEKLSVSDISDQQLHDLLHGVSLGYLLDRADHQRGEEVNWDAVLSLGEKQRLAIASLLYHKPKFAILDECTSALDTQMERKLYAICADLNITYITISHRPVLQAYHDMMLTIGKGDNGYTLVDLPARKPLPSLSPSKSALDTSTTIMSANRLDTVSSSIPQRSSWERLLRLLRLGLKPEHRVKLGLYVLGTVAQCRLMIDHTLVTSGMMACVFSLADRSSRVREFFSLCMWGSIYSLAATLLEEANALLQSEMRVDFHEALAARLQDKYMAQQRFYNMLELDQDPAKAVHDPAQRLSHDIKALADELFDLLPMVKPLVEIAWFALRVQALVGVRATMAFGIYLAGGMTAIRAIMPNFKRLVTKERDLLGKYKFVHGRVKTHAESIAFFSGDAREREIVDKRFAALMETNWARLKTNWGFGLFNQAIVREAPMLVQWLLRNEYSKRTFKNDASVIKDAGQELNYNQLFLFNATNYTFEAIAAVLASQEKIANLSGLITRVAQLEEALDRCSSVRDERTLTANNEAVRVKGLDLVTPAGVVLAKQIALTVTQDRALIVTGRTGAGKTSFFRVLGGLWPKPAEAVIELPQAKELCLVPQKVYCPPGNLVDQITYPVRIEERTKEDEEMLLELLQTVGVAYLAERMDGWDTVTRWEDVLSLGEQQRLGMARLFFHRPKFGVLDECTSAVSVDVEEGLYRKANELGIACITISQRLALHEFHAQQLILGDLESANRWSLTEVKSEPLTKRLASQESNETGKSVDMMDLD